MEATTNTLIVLLAVITSSAVSRVRIVSPPLPFVQIALGAAIAVTFDIRISLDPEIFLLLFVAPLLFLDGWRIPREGLFRDKWTVIALALGLVIFTVLGAGLFIHWMIRTMPLAVAFALAAVISPTDAVGVSAISLKNPLPKRLMHILEGESLLNDASGLVCLQFAVLAATTGTFSIVGATSAFVWMAAGGISIGIAVSLLANATKDWIATHVGEEPGAQILISFLLPFGVYVLAEYFKASGILAAVAAGIVMSYEERAGRASAATRIRRAAVWDALQFAGNGTIFVLLGHQLPDIVHGAGKALGETGRQDDLWLLVYVLAIGGVLVTLRALWTWATLGLILFRTAPGQQEIQMPGWRLIAVTSLAGVRGAVTLAGVMTLPLTLKDGSTFPARDLAIFLAAGTIILSLLAATIGLPQLLKGVQLPPETLARREEDDARLAAAQAAIKAIERSLQYQGEDEQEPELYIEAGAKITRRYRELIEAHPQMGKDAPRARKLHQIERKLLLVALHAERNELYRISRSGRLRDEIAGKLIREIDLQESRFKLR